MAEMLGYTVDEMVGRHLSDFLDQDGMRVAQASTQRQRGGAKERMKISFVRKDGTELCALISVAEGVEDGETLERLRELDIEHAQGCYLGGPQILDLKSVSGSA